MSTTNTTPLSPEAELEKLEQDAVDGKPVTADQLANARAAIDLAALVSRGKEKREQAAAEKAAAKAREDAKKAVSGMLDGAPDALLHTFDQAVASLEALYAAHQSYQERIQQAGQTLSDARVPNRGWAHEPIPEDYDPLFSAAWADGGVVHAVTVAGHTHHAGPIAEWIRTAIHPVLWAHRETQSFAAKIGTGRRPQLLQERDDA